MPPRRTNTMLWETWCGSAECLGKVRYFCSWIPADNSPTGFTLLMDFDPWNWGIAFAIFSMGSSLPAALAGPPGASHSPAAGAACPCGQLFTENPPRISLKSVQPFCDPLSKMSLLGMHTIVLGRQTLGRCLSVGIAPCGHSCTQNIAPHLLANRTRSPAPHISF